MILVFCFCFQVPRRLAEGGEAHFPSTVEDHFRPMYFSALDTIIKAITERFDQPGYHQYEMLEGCILKGARGQDITEELSHLVKLYSDDVKHELLAQQLKIVHSHFAGIGLSEPSLGDVSSYVQKLPNYQVYLSEVVSVLTLVLVCPATNATSERAFSALRRLKTYLRSTMTQQRLNSCAVLHVHKEQCDQLELREVANDLVGSNEHRYHVFGIF